MFKYNFSDYLWLYLLAVIAWAVIFSIVRGISKQVSRGNIFYFLLLAIAFSFLGLTIGIHIGLSESPVIGLIIPALLTFIGGLMIYAFIFADKSKIQDGYVLLVILISLSFFLMLGSDYACSARTDYDARQQDYQLQQKRYFELFTDSLSKSKGHMEQPAAATKIDTAAANLFKKIVGH